MTLTTPPQTDRPGGPGQDEALRGSLGAAPDGGRQPQPDLQPRPTPSGTGEGTGPQPRLHLLVAAADAAARSLYVCVLGGLGYQLALAESSQQMLQLARRAKPDLLVADLPPGDQDRSQAVQEWCKEFALPVVLVCGGGATGLPALVEAGYVMACLLKHVVEAELAVAVELAVRRFAQLQGLRQEAEVLRRQLEERKLIERAKGAVMRRVVGDEQEAFRRLRKFSTDHNLKLAEAAQQVIQAEELFANLERDRHPTMKPVSGRRSQAW